MEYHIKIRIGNQHRRYVIAHFRSLCVVSGLGNELGSKGIYKALLTKVAGGIADCGGNEANFLIACFFRHLPCCEANFILVLIDVSAEIF